jgi:hypothetical protein
MSGKRDPILMNQITSWIRPGLWDVRSKVYLDWRQEVERLLSGGQLNQVADRGYKTGTPELGR